jgi:tRNA-2-methylthio-N6-dimethylallyladenosine synthase
MNDDKLVQISSKIAASNQELPGVFIKTYGCQMNVYDTEKILKVLENRYRSVDQLQDAELVILNTCSVREKPEQKLYSILGELKDYRITKPELMIGVGGCVAQQEGQKILSKGRAVDFVFGTHNLSLIPTLIDRVQDGYGPQVAVDYRDEWEDLPVGFSGEGRVSVFVSVSRGCNKNCSYCIVPTTRGQEVSRSLEEIEREIKISVHRGAKEIVLLGQTVNSYGLDLSPRLRFVDLLEKVSAVDGVERIRFFSPHPQEVKKDFFDLVARNPKVCRHIHMPLQSGSDNILKAMNRNYRRQKYLDIIAGLKQAAPDISITTDMIIGFPGETDQDFEQTMDILEQVRFEHSYSFSFSPRPGTEAAKLAGQVPDAVKAERLKRYQSRQDQITTEYLQTWVGKEGEVLIDGPSALDPQALQGRLSQNILVNLARTDLPLEPGQLVPVRITESARFTLKGELLPTT